MNGFRFAETPLAHYVEKLQTGTVFSFARYGDGEWNAILGAAGANCDGHEYFPQLGKDLGDSLTCGDGCIYGMQPLAIKRLRKGIQHFLRQNNIRIQWHDADVMHKANNAGALYPMIEQIRLKPVVLVGPPHLRSIRETVFPYRSFIEVPPKNCYLHTSAIVSEILTEYQTNGPAIYAFSASMAAKVIIHRLLPDMGNDSWLIDFGSLWDVYVGVTSRSNYADAQWKQRIAVNCGIRHE